MEAKLKVSSFTKDVLRCRRIRKELIAQGYEEVSENGGKLWELHRGNRIGHEISDVEIGPEKKSLFIKTRSNEQHQQQGGGSDGSTV